MDIENLIRHQKVFTCLFAGDGLSLEEVEQAIDRQFSDEVAGIYVRPVKNGSSIKVTITHEEDFDRDAHIEKLRRFAVEHKWSWLILPDHHEVPEFRMAVIEASEGVNGLQEALTALQDSGVATVVLPSEGPPPQNMALDHDGLLFIGRTPECLHSANCAVFLGPDVPAEEHLHGALTGSPADMVLFFE